METEYNSDIDKGELEGEVLIEIYADLGLKLMYNDPATDRVQKFQEKYGDIRNELIHLRDQDAITIDEETNYISLKHSDRTIARKIANEVHNEKKHPVYVSNLSWIPEYLSEPEMEEEYNKPLEDPTQDPDEDVVAPVIEVLSEDALKPHQVEEELVADINFEIEPWLKYLETQDILERSESGHYSLVEENIVERFLEGGFNSKGQIKERDRYGNDPWKP
jgi:hypothetical protein